jgi:predicted amidohydrolase YtcJ
MKKESRPLWRIFWTLTVGVAALGCSQSGTIHSKADLVIRGGKIITVGPDMTEAEAIAVTGPWISAVGTVEEVGKWVGPETQVIDLGGRAAIPGFIESHGHFLGMGEFQTIIDLTDAASWEEIVARVKGAAAATPPGEWIRGRGWHQDKWEKPPEILVQGSPVHHTLSAVSPDNPVFLTHAAGSHAAFANAYALQLGGVTSATPDPPGGEIIKDKAGNPTGLLREKAMRLVDDVRTGGRSGESFDGLEGLWRRYTELAGETALSHGVTSFHDAAGVQDGRNAFAMIDFFRKLEDEGALPLRMYAMARSDSIEELTAKLATAKAIADGNDFLAVRGLKLQLDGALGSHGAWLLEPYDDLPESSGFDLVAEANLRQTARLAIEHGFQLNTHAIGDRANRVILDVYEEAFQNAGGLTDHRWRVEHAQHVHPDDIPRFSKLGVIASMQAVHCTSDGPWVPTRLGKARARATSYRWREFIDQGTLIANGTDVPVEEIDPIAGFHALVTRLMNNGESFYPDQVMTREEALLAYTFNGAYAAFEDHLKGSLEVGKLADIAILSKDIMSIPRAEILTTQVDLTILGGEVKFQREL